MGEMYGVNIGCLEGLTDEDLSRLTIVCVDGRDDNWQDPPAHCRHL
jgi:hypothetical protein